MRLYDYQEAAMPALQAALEHQEKRLCLLNASTGFGKTYMALELLKRSNSSCLVLCPKATLGQWRDSAEAVGVRPKLLTNPEKLRTGSRCAAVQKISASNWKWHCIEPGDVLVLDEIHRYGAPDSQLAFMAACALRSGARVLGLSATLADSPLKMRLLLHAARLVSWNDFFAWARSVGCWRDTDINGAPWRPPRGRLGLETMDRLNRMFFPAYGVRLRSEEIPGFPEVTNIVDLVTPSEAARKAIDAAYSAMADELRNPDAAKTELVRLLRWRQLVEMNKLHVFRELVEDGLEDGYSVVASFNFTESLFQFSEMMARHRPAMIYGSDRDGRQQTDGARETEKRRFQTNETRLLLLTIQAGGVGLSLGDELGGHPRLAFHNLPLSTVDLVQLMGRIHRADSKTKSVNRIVLIHGVGVESHVFSILNRKIGNLSALQADALDLRNLIKDA